MSTFDAGFQANPATGFPPPPPPPPPPSTPPGWKRPLPPPPYGWASAPPPNPAHGRDTTPLQSASVGWTPVKVQNVLLGLGVASVLAAAVTLVVANWSRMGAQARGGVLVAATLLAAGLAALSHHRGLRATTEAMAVIAVAFAFVDVQAVRVGMASGTDPRLFWSLGLFALVGVIGTFGWFVRGVAPKVGVVGAALVGTWLQLLYRGVRGPDVYALPVALLLLAVVPWVLRDNDLAGSWERFGPGLVLGFSLATMVALKDPGIARPLTVVVCGCVAVMVGAYWHQRAPLTVGVAVLAVLGWQQSWRAATAVPNWVVFGLVGIVLLATGATYEQRRRDLERLRRHLKAFR